MLACFVTKIHTGDDITKYAVIGFDKSERYRDLGCAIAYYRKRRGLTQEQVAEQTGISRQHMGAIEAPNMVRPVSLSVLFNIATVLEIEPHVLLKFAPDKPEI